MPKYSHNQTGTEMLFRDALEQIEALAVDASSIDSELLTIARNARKYASVWVRCNTENGGRAEMKAQASRLVERATSDARTPVAFALMSLGLALREFAACNYRNADQYIAHARRVVLVSQATTDRALA